MESDHSFLDGLDWLRYDHDEDLNLRLQLHDYTARPNECRRPPSPDSSSRPSLFRHRLPTTKLPSLVSRPSVSSTRRPSVENALHVRRKSRALSLIHPRQSTHASSISMDTAAVHYQDTSARSKLRAYLASPQKFDEALEYGFLAAEVRPSQNEDAPPVSPTSPGLATFLIDDASSVYSREVSTPDPESPRTPHTLESQSQQTLNNKPLHLTGNIATVPSKLSHGQGLEPALSREMTMRITLTRPDLRSGADSLHGWRRPPIQHRQASSQSLPFRVDSPVSTLGTSHATKDSLDRIFADIDQELGGHTGSADGIAKRFWNRVRRN
ncbi:hypothetical protein F5Y16DRAFT_371638 [Xylariaceae sp. FL0255]|nr:hypothetical protein F5Y16DRAFT_371638 [Xylariaceae sp. FL0255]